MTKNIELKQIDGHFYGINNEKLKRGFFYCNRRRVFFDDEGDDTYCCEGDFSIIFSTQPLEGVPMLVLPSEDDEIEKLANEFYPLNDEIYPNSTLIRKAFIAGCKANQKQFTKEQVFEIMAHIYTHTREDERGVRRFVTGKVATNTDILNDYLQSLTPIPVSVDVEFEHWRKDGDGGKAFKTETPKIKTHQRSSRSGKGLLQIKNNPKMNTPEKAADELIDKL